MSSAHGLRLLVDHAHLTLPFVLASCRVRLRHRPDATADLSATCLRTRARYRRKDIGRKRRLGPMDRGVPCAREALRAPLSNNRARLSHPRFRAPTTPPMGACPPPMAARCPCGHEKVPGQRTGCRRSWEVWYSSPTTTTEALGDATKICRACHHTNAGYLDSFTGLFLVPARKAHRGEVAD